MKLFTTIAVVAIILAGGIYVYFEYFNKVDVVTNDGTDIAPEFVVEETTPEPVTEVEEVVDEKETVIGSSVQGNEITAYHYGQGDTELLFVGGMHGGYSWNTVEVAYELMDYLDKNEGVVPENIRVTVIPVLNPDGLQKIVGTTERFSVDSVPENQVDTIPGRFNANTVDLNRNFDCDWQASGTWQNKTVSGGSAPFSEPESQALKNYVENNNPKAVVVWYSSVGGVFASNCHNGILPETTVLTNLYANASGYKAYENFDFYEITGDAVNWLAKNNIPAISVLLTTHDDSDWDRNYKGFTAMLEHYSK